MKPAKESANSGKAGATLGGKATKKSFKIRRSQISAFLHDKIASNSPSLSWTEPLRHKIQASSETLAKKWVIVVRFILFWLFLVLELLIQVIRLTFLVFLVFPSYYMVFLATKSINVLFSHFQDIWMVFEEVTVFWIRKLLINSVPNWVKIRRCKAKMRSSTSYTEWAYYADLLDELLGLKKWKHETESDLYDFVMIEKRLEDLQLSRRSGDFKSMMFLLRSGLHRNLGGLGSPELFKVTHVGTKKLIEKYIDEVVFQIIYIATKYNVKKLEDQYEALSFIKDTRQAFGRTALCLSGGGSLGMFHLGVIKTLIKENLLPTIISGSSAGSLAAGLLCCTNNEEMLYLIENLHLIHVSPFDEEIEVEVEEQVCPIIIPESTTQTTAFPANLQPPSFFHEAQSFPTSPTYTTTVRTKKMVKANFIQSLLIKARRFYNTGAFADNEKLGKALKALLGDITFIEAFSRSGRILSVSINSRDSSEPPRLLNYLTCPNVLLRSALAASASLPGLFKTTPLLMKNRTGEIVIWSFFEEEWSDGSAETDLPMQKLSEMFNVNHFIVSQVNPHIVPFIKKSGLISGLFRMFPTFRSVLYNEVKHFLHQLHLLNIDIFGTTKILTNMLSQKYDGDITIVPEMSFSTTMKIATSIPEEEVRDWVHISERATWEKIGIIQSHMEIELALDRAYKIISDRILMLSDTQHETLSAHKHLITHPHIHNKLLLHRRSTANSPS